jgi:hypothetical protein
MLSVNYSAPKEHHEPSSRTLKPNRKRFVPDRKHRYHGQLHWIRWLRYRMQSVVLKKSSLVDYKMELASDNRVDAYYAEQTNL